ncbi:acetyltransferase (GNAT) family protein [Flavobacteriaceae bacterium MAR_2009_75]|nr:acetyltransferase (GNAT) family protein [Flavobacteriaceae bacterium MAR_2009_75]
MSLEIVPYTSSFATSFKNLNLEWINTYFQVEPKDVEVLENCEEAIINQGGHIFLAKYGGQIAGCFAFIPFDKDSYELGKMAVAPNFRGKKIGQALLTFAINFAKENQWSNIVLYSNTKLNNALHIYRKNGFIEIPMEPETVYKRSNIKMILDLNAQTDSLETNTIIKKTL